MISLAELNPRGHALSNVQKENQALLLHAVNVVRVAYGKPMTVTSGVRDWNEHVAIYVKRGAIELHPDGTITVLPGRSFPRKSSHLSGAAADFADPHGELAQWCRENIKTLETAGIWCEWLQSTIGWVHMQCVPPASGNRFFKP